MKKSLVNSYDLVTRDLQVWFLIRGTNGFICGSLSVIRRTFARKGKEE